MPIVPKTTNPLSKFIRTGEGILVFAFNLVLLIVPIVSNALTAEQSAKWAAIIDGIAVVSRTGLKAVATVQGVTGIAPEQIGTFPPNAVQAPPPAQQLPGVSPPQVAPAPVASLGAVSQPLVSDEEEFAGAPSPEETQPSLAIESQSWAVSAPDGAPQPVGLVGSGSRPQPSPFLARLGE